MAPEKITKAEWILLGLTAVFLSGLLVVSSRDRRETAAPVETERAAAQEEFLPDLSPLDLNTATEAELAELPGIGEELARRIVAYREENGPFATVEELLEISGIGQGKLDALTDRVIAGAAGKERTA